MGCVVVGVGGGGVEERNGKASGSEERQAMVASVTMTKVGCDSCIYPLSSHFLIGSLLRGVSSTHWVLLERIL